MPANSIIDAPVARLRQAKWSLAAKFVITTSLWMASFITSAPVFAETLAVGSVYFDSEQTLNEVINLSSKHDNEGIANLIKNGHISERTQEEQKIVILISAPTPESPTEFRFLNGPTTFWTLARNVSNSAKPIPTPTVESTPLTAESSTPSSKRHSRQNDKWKWQHANKRHVSGWPSAANPRVSPSPAATLPSSSIAPSPTPLIMNEGTNLYNSERTQPFKDYKKPAAQ